MSSEQPYDITDTELLLNLDGGNCGEVKITLSCVQRHGRNYIYVQDHVHGFDAYMHRGVLPDLLSWLKQANEWAEK